MTMLVGRLLLLVSSLLLSSCWAALAQAGNYWGIPEDYYLLTANQRQHGQGQPGAADLKDRPDVVYGRENLQFQISVVYAAAEESDHMGLRGSHLGLSMDTSTPMAKLDATTWSLNVTYNESAEGATCQDVSTCDSFLPSGQQLIFRAVLDRDGIETTMKGYDYELQFPLSMVSEAFPGDTHPSFTVHPWFFAEKGEVVEIVVESVDPDVGSRRIEVYLPPSASENPVPVYDVMLAFDLNQDEMPLAAPVFDYVFAELGTAKEAVVVGHGDFSYVVHSDRANMLTPSTGYVYDCVEGTFPDACNGCIDTSSFEAYMQSILFEGCCIVSEGGGKADQSMDYVLYEVFPKVNDLLANRVGNTRLTEDRQKTMLMGFSLGGLMSCYMLWTRPEVFGRGGCHSASLWWPISIDYEAKTWESNYYFMNNTLLDPKYLENRPKQWVLMDVGAPEEDDRMHMQLAPQIVFEFLDGLDAFEANVNLWFHSYMGQIHTWEAWAGRMWSVLSALSIGRAYP